MIIYECGWREMRKTSATYFQPVIQRRGNCWLGLDQVGGDRLNVCGRLSDPIGLPT